MNQQRRPPAYVPGPQNYQQLPHQLPSQIGVGGYGFIQTQPQLMPLTYISGQQQIYQMQPQQVRPMPHTHLTNVQTPMRLDNQAQPQVAVQQGWLHMTPPPANQPLIADNKSRKHSHDAMRR